MASFHNPLTNENVKIEMQAIDSSLDGIEYLFKMSGPQKRFYSYKVKISRTVLHDIEVGFGNDRKKAELGALRDVEKFIAQGRYYDIEFFCNPQYPPKPSLTANHC